MNEINHIRGVFISSSPKNQKSKKQLKWTNAVLGQTHEHERNKTESLLLGDSSVFQTYGNPTNIHHDSPITCSEDFVGDEILPHNYSLTWLTDTRRRKSATNWVI